MEKTTHRNHGKKYCISPFDNDYGDTVWYNTDYSFPYVITLYFIDPRWFDGVSEESYAPAKVRVKVVYNRNEMDSCFYVEEEPLTVVMSKTGDEETDEEDYSWYLKLAGRQ